MISKLKNRADEWISNEGGLVDIALDHFQEIVSTYRDGMDTRWSRHMDHMEILFQLR